MKPPTKRPASSGQARPAKPVHSRGDGLSSPSLRGRFIAIASLQFTPLGLVPPTISHPSHHLSSFPPFIILPTICHTIHHLSSYPPPVILSAAKDLAAPEPDPPLRPR